MPLIYIEDKINFTDMNTGHDPDLAYDIDWWYWSSLGLLFDPDQAGAYFIQIRLHIMGIGQTGGTFKLI